MVVYSKKERALLAKFGSRLKKIRQEKNMSQEKLAEVCNLHRTYIGSAERGGEEHFDLKFAQDS